MITPGEKTREAIRRSSSWRADDGAPHTIENWGYNVNVPSRDVPLDYAVITEGSAFPAGWVRFDRNRQAYVFSTLLPGRQIPAAVHADPEQAVPAWVGAYRLKAIRPIPEEVTGDMLAAAPAMLAVLKQVHALMAQDESLLPGLDLEDLSHVLAVAEGRA
ncbi:MAG TPA: hypothetical protein VLV87_10910 [Gammaproteobacteria bacterium]|nr:hypothetical protein [Gammaproteobacteria bacterium]